MKARPGASAGALAVAASVVLAGCAQILMKLSMLALAEGIASGSAWASACLSAPVLPWLAAGLICYGISLLAWLIALARFDLSYAYPFLGASYVLVYLVAVTCPQLDESLTATRAAGIALVALGTTLVWRTGGGRRDGDAPGITTN